MLGSIPYLAMLLSIGLLLLKLCKVDTEDLSESLGLSFALGLAFTTLVVSVLTLGSIVPGITLAGLTGYESYTMLIPSIALLAIMRLRGKRLLPKPTKGDIIPLASLAFLGIVLLLHFTKYPIFPKYSSVDFEWHVKLSQELANGSYTLIPSGILYYGAHAQSALLHQLNGGLPLADTQLTMAVLTLLSPLLIYATSKGIFMDTYTAQLTSLAYVATGFIWYGSVFNAGLYSNFYGILAGLSLVALLAKMLKEPSKLLWLLYLMLILNLYVSHYSSLLLILSLPIAAVVAILKRSITPKQSPPFIAPLAIGALGATVHPSMVGSLLSFLSPTGYEALTGDTALSMQLSSAPVMRYLAGVITQDLATTLLILLALLALPKLYRNPKPLTTLPTAWLGLTLLTAPPGPTAWRFSYAALTPLLLLAGTQLSQYKPPQHTKAPTRTKGLRSRLGTLQPQARGLATLTLILLALSTYGWTHLALADTLKDNQLHRMGQLELLKAIDWIKENTPPNSRFLIITDWRLERYLEPLTGRHATMLFLAKPDQAITKAYMEGYQYIVLTRVVPAEVPQDPEQNPLNTYPKEPALKLAYQNQNVLIYTLK